MPMHTSIRGAREAASWLRSRDGSARAAIDARTVVTHSVADRVVGCLTGIAIGDAIGKQTETLAHADIARWYPNGVRRFEGDPGSVIPRYLGNSRREWRIGETTDDTERTIAV